MPPPSDDISWWFCCIDTPERTVFRQTAEGFTLTLFLGFPLAVWDAFWVVTAHNTGRFKDVFRQLYHVKIGTIEVEGVPVDAVMPEDGYGTLWVLWALYMLDPDAACLDGCAQSQRPAP